LKKKFIEKSNLIHSNKYDYSLVDYKNNKTKVKIICPIHGIFEQTPYHHICRKQGCSKCSKKYKPNTKEFIDKCLKIHENRYDYSLVDYKNNKTKIKIICPIHGIFEQTPNNHINLKQKCPFCEKNIPTTEEFINECKKIHENRYDYSLVDYKNNKTKIKIICPIHGVFEQYPYAHLKKKQGCNLCYKKNMFDDIYTFIEKSNLIHNNKYDYSLTNYINSKTKVKIICPKHGVFEQIPNDHINGSGCPKCKESIGEKIIRDILDWKNVFYQCQKSFDNCKNINKLTFDFYLPKYNICIEYDGEQHYKPIEFFGGSISLKKQKIRDGIKTRFCKENDIKLIRIGYNENINEKLSKID